MKDGQKLIKKDTATIANTTHRVMRYKHPHLLPTECRRANAVCAHGRWDCNICCQGAKEGESLCNHGGSG